jgi:hypothetical protein
VAPLESAGSGSARLGVFHRLNVNRDSAKDPLSRVEIDAGRVRLGAPASSQPFD